MRRVVPDGPHPRMCFVVPSSRLLDTNHRSNLEACVSTPLQSSSDGKFRSFWQRKISDGGVGKLDVWPPPSDDWCKSHPDFGKPSTVIVGIRHGRERLPRRQPRRTARISPVASRSSNVAFIHHWSLMLSRSEVDPPTRSRWMPSSRTVCRFRLGAKQGFPSQI